jgi:sugar/nucleoside kinase (ribokinase family)
LVWIILAMYDILVAGEINPDLILSGNVEPVFNQVEKLVDNFTLSIGSSCAIFACGAARLGLKVGFIGKCGEDIFGRFMLEEMSRRGVDIGPVIRVADKSTGFCVILNKGADRAILSYPGLIPELNASDISDELLKHSRHLHVASYFLQTSLQPGLLNLFSRARRLGLTTSLDTNFDPEEKWTGLDDLLGYTNVFLPNETEACAIAGIKDIDVAADILAAKVETLAIKMGAQGALGVFQNKKIRFGSIPVKLVDTVGAGDSFDAGFLYGYLNQWPFEKSLKLASICGTLSTRMAGGTTAQATLQEAIENGVN